MRKVNHKDLIPKIATALAVMSTAVLLFYQLDDVDATNSLRSESYLRRLDSSSLNMSNLYREQIDVIRSRIDKLSLEINLLSDSSSVSNESIKNRQYELRLIQTEESIKDLNQKYKSLQQAIDPINPEEVLTIARLQDEIIKIYQTLSNLENQYNSRQVIFEQSIIREMEKADKTTYLIIGALLPLILNMLYQIWNNFNQNKRAQKKA